MIPIQAIFYNNPDGYPPIVNGARILNDAGFSLELFCRNSNQCARVTYPPQTVIQRITIHSRWSWVEYLGFTIEVIRRSGSDKKLFIGHDMHGLLPARLLATRYRCPLVYHCHDFAEVGGDLALGGRLVKLFERRFARTADLVIVPDRERSAVVATELNLLAPPLVAANAPIHTFRGTGDALKQAVRDHSSNSVKKIVFRQGRIAPGHAIEETIRSIRFWDCTNWVFAVMGPGDTAYVNSLKALAVREEVSEQFVVLPAISYDDLAQYTPGADLGHALYLPTHVNNVHITTASNKLMEYMAAGLPILVSDRPALRRFVTRHACGVTADESSPRSIANAVNELLGTPDRARQMGVAGQEAFKHRYRYAYQFAPVVETIKDLIT